MPEKAKALLPTAKLYRSTQPRTPAESAGGGFFAGHLPPGRFHDSWWPRRDSGNAP